MDTLVLRDIQAELVTIRWLLIAVGALLLTFIVYWSYFIKQVRKISKHQALDEGSQRFRKEAEALMQKGDIKKLKSVATSRLEVFPQDVWGLWYVGIADLRSKRYQEAKDAFSKIKQLNPGWSKSVDPYLKELDEILGSLTSETIQ